MYGLMSLTTFFGIFKSLLQTHGSNLQVIYWMKIKALNCLLIMRKQTKPPKILFRNCQTETPVFDVFKYFKIPEIVSSLSYLTDVESDNFASLSLEISIAKIKVELLLQVSKYSSRVCIPCDTDEHAGWDAEGELAGTTRKPCSRSPRATRQ